jgi:hypothetical protein
MLSFQPLPHSYKNSELEVISSPGPVVTYSDAERERIPFVARSTEIPMDMKTVMHCCMLRIEKEGAMNCLGTKCVRPGYFRETDISVLGTQFRYSTNDNSVMSPG